MCVENSELSADEQANRLTTRVEPRNVYVLNGCRYIHFSAVDNLNSILTGMKMGMISRE